MHAIPTSPPARDAALAAYQEQPLTPPRMSPAAAEVSLDELIQRAVAANPEIRAARLRAESLRSRVPQVTSLEDPTLTTTAWTDPIQTAAGSQDLNLAIAQRLPWFGKLGLRGDLASQEAWSAWAEAAARELAVAEQVKLAYYELYFLAGAIEVNQELEPQLEDVIEIVRTKFEVGQGMPQAAGMRPIGLETLLQAQVELSALQTRLVQLEQARVRALARLAEALSLPRGAELRVDRTYIATPLPDSAAVLVDMVDRCQPELEEQRWQIARSRTAVALAYKNYYPDFNLGFTWHAIDSQGLSPVANGDDAYSIMVGVNMPIYRSRLNAAVREARLNVSEASQEFEATWDQLRADIESMYAEAIEHERVLAILSLEIIPKAEQTLELAIESFRLDRLDYVQLIDSYEELLEYRIEQYQRQAQREQAIATLERRVGCVVATWPGTAEPLPAPAPPIR